MPTPWAAAERAYSSIRTITVKARYIGKVTVAARSERRSSSAGKSSGALYDPGQDQQVPGGAR